MTVSTRTGLQAKVVAASSPMWAIPLPLPPAGLVSPHPLSHPPNAPSASQDHPLAPCGPQGNRPQSPGWPRSPPGAGTSPILSAAPPCFTQHPSHGEGLTVPGGALHSCCLSSGNVCGARRPPDGPAKGVCHGFINPACLAIIIASIY